MTKLCLGCMEQYSDEFSTRMPGEAAVIDAMECEKSESITIPNSVMEILVK